MLDQFYQYLRYELNRAPLTVESYKTDISQFQEWITNNKSEDIDFTTVTPNDIRTWLASLMRSGLNPRSIRRKIIALRSLYRWMIKTGKIDSSPLSRIPLPKIPKHLPDIIKPQEIETSLKNIKESGETEQISCLKFLIVEMLYSLGIRRAELIGLNDSDISFSKGELKVTGKRSKQRVIPVPQRLLDKIKEWQNIREEEKDPSPSSPLFVLKGKRITPNQVYRIVKNSLSNTTARKKSPHALRHSFASGMLNGGAEIDSVREFLGHASLATTQIYTHISLNEIKKAYTLAHPRSEKKK